MKEHLSDPNCTCVENERRIMSKLAQNSNDTELARMAYQAHEVELDDSSSMTG